MKIRQATGRIELPASTWQNNEDVLKTYQVFDKHPKRLNRV